MASRWLARGGALALLALAVRLPAQSAVFGGFACADCAGVSELPTPTLFGFKLADGDLDAEPDVLFDARLAGGSRIVGCDVVAGSWQILPNWRAPQEPSDTIVAVVLDEGVLAFDAAARAITEFDFGIVLPQATCSFGGGAAPRVLEVPSGRAVEWNPVMEENTDLHPGGCTPAGSAARTFVIGYNIYRLDVAAFPAPTRRDFLVSGFVAHADALRLDFGVMDPDGLSGSDRDPADNLRLRNPDGLPDTGDEVLEWHDLTVGAEPAWYRIQPVVRGDQSAVRMFGVPVRRLDLDGDGTLESMDIGDDGFLEFIDPSGRGLGLTYAGEIASSLWPGLAAPPPVELGCDGQIIGETDCTNGIDDNGNGYADCEEPACCGHPACIVAPPEVSRVDVARVGRADGTVVTWTTVAPLDSHAVFDVLSGVIAPSRGDRPGPGCLWGDRGIQSGGCLADDGAILSAEDPRSITPDIAGFWYLVRGQARCGAATSYGSDSFGHLRVPGAADCSR